MNAVVISVAVMLTLSLCRVHVIIAMIIGALVGGIVGELSIAETLKFFNAGLGNGANIALSYAMLGAFALAIAKSGLAHALADKAHKLIGKSQNKGLAGLRLAIITVVLLAAMSSQNILPIHIAFIPLLIPPLIPIFNRLLIDRRLMACVMTFGLITPYMVLPFGFGNIFLKQIVIGNITQSGLDVTNVSVLHAMFIPALGMLFGLLVAVFFSYRRPRQYDAQKQVEVENTNVPYSAYSLSVAFVAIVVAFGLQIWLDSMIIGALAGFMVFLLGRVVRWSEADHQFTQGMRMMAMIGFIMITANGFAEVMKATGDVQSLVDWSAQIIGHNKALGALLMLLVGLLITMGIGSSFSTVPIIAAIFVPLCISLGFSPLATVALVATSGALGDAGSPASDSTLGPTSGLDIDGQHNHIWDTVVPTFLHYNLPVIVAGWIAAMVL